MVLLRQRTGRCAAGGNRRANVTAPTLNPEPACLGCGYLLVGLPTTVCPECGKEFDPADGRTFDNVWRTKYRRRKLRRKLWLVVVAILIACSVPQGIWKGELAFTCTHCRQRNVVTRWQLLAPRWLPVRYPGLHWTGSEPSGSGSASSCVAHNYSVFFRNEIWHTRFASMTPIRKIPMLRSQSVTRPVPGNANDVLRMEIWRHLDLEANRPFPPRKVPYLD